MSRSDHPVRPKQIVKQEDDFLRNPHDNPAFAERLQEGMRILRSDEGGADDDSESELEGFQEIEDIW